MSIVTCNFFVSEEDLKEHAMLANSSGILFRSRTQKSQKCLCFFYFLFWKKAIFQSNRRKVPVSSHKMTLWNLWNSFWEEDELSGDRAGKLRGWDFPWARMWEMSWKRLSRNSLFDQDLLICNFTWPACVSNQVMAWLFSKKLERKNRETINLILLVHQGEIRKIRKIRKKKGKNKQAQIM